MNDESKESRSAPATETQGIEKVPGETMPDEVIKPGEQGIEAKRGKHKIRKDRDSRSERN